MNITHQEVLFCFVVIVGIILIAKDKGVFNKNTWIATEAQDKVFSQIDESVDAEIAELAKQERFGKND